MKATRSRLLVSLGMMSTALVLIGCDDDSDSRRFRDVTPPTVLSVSPADGATGVATDALVSATFSDTLLNSSVTDTSFTLSNGSAVAGDVSLASGDETARFAAQPSLPLLSSITATLGTTITDEAGNALAAPYSWSFTTADGSWGSEALLETDDAGQAYAPRVAANAAGHAVAAWVQSDGTNYLMTVNRYLPGAGWQGAETVQTDLARNSDRARVVIDDDGNITAVWVQENAGRYSLWSRRYETGSGWGNAELLETDDTGDADYPEIAIDGDGNVIAVWHQYDSVRHNVWTNRFDAGAWGTATLLESDNNNAVYPHVAMAESGDAMAIWVQSDGARSNAAGRYYDAGTDTWQAVASLENGSGDVQSPRVAIDTDGNALAVWYQSDGSVLDVMSNRYVPGSGWGTAAAISALNQNGYDPKIAMTPDGDALAVWYQYDGTRYNVWANRYDHTAGWGSAELLETEETVSSDTASVVVDTNGNGVAVWIENDDSGTLNLMANRYVAGTGWSPAEAIESSTETLNAGAALAVDGGGRITAVWAQSNGAEDSLYANRFQ